MPATVCGMGYSIGITPTDGDAAATYSYHVMGFTVNCPAFSQIDWGSAPAWVAAAVGGAAAFGALATLRSQKVQLREQRTFIAEQSKVLQLQHEELSAAAERRKWSQAEKVAVEAGTANLQGGQLGLGSVSVQQPLRRMLWVHNKSAAPLRDVQVMFGSQHAAVKAVVSGLDGRKLSCLKGDRL
jgi:hypothetical protein